MIEPEPIITLGSREVYANPWIRVREDEVAFPNGHTGIYGVITASPCVGILPITDDGQVVMVRQWRYVIEQCTWEMPTGGAHPGEALEDAAQRELAEECGYRATTLRHLSTFSTSKSVLDETANLFLATGLESVTAETVDHTEQIQRATFPFDEVLAMVVDGEILDAMTIIAVLMADRLVPDREWAASGSNRQPRT